MCVCGYSFVLFNLCVHACVHACVCGYSFVLFNLCVHACVCGYSFVLFNLCVHACVCLVIPLYCLTYVSMRVCVWLFLCIV